MNFEMEEVEEPLLTYWDPSAPPKYSEAPPMFNPVPPESTAVTFQTNPSEHPYQPQVLPQNCTYDYQFQDNLPNPDNAMEDEVIRAAKSMFSKRTRTLLHWMNPEMDKSVLKLDVDDAWNNLPDQEKNLYISQVLGKLTVCTTGLMVNSHLEKSKTLSFYNTARSLSKPKEESLQAPQIKRKYTRRKLGQNIQDKEMNETNVPTLGELNDTINKPSYDQQASLLVPRMKRKYTRQKPQQNVLNKTNALMLDELSYTTINSGPDTSSGCTTASDVGSTTDTNLAPRVKRKYVKRKLVRKKYTRKNKLDIGQKELSLPLSTNSSPQDKSSECEEGDVWIHHYDELLFKENPKNFELLDEEVDQFWDHFGDPAKLFRAMEIV